MKDQKEVKSKRPLKRKEKKIEEQKPAKVIIEYIDPVQVINANPMHYEPCVFQAIGWAFDLGSHYVLIPEISISHRLFEYGFPESSLLIPKNAIEAIWDVTGQTLRSRKDH